MADKEELIDYEEEDEIIQPASVPATKKQTTIRTITSGNGKTDTPSSSGGEGNKGSYVGIHSTGFRDFLLKPELLRAIVDCGFEHPSEVQQVCLPQSILGMDVLCQAKSGMGKTAVFVLATLQQLEEGRPSTTTTESGAGVSTTTTGSANSVGGPSVIVLCHTRELAFQIRNEYARFAKYMPSTRTGVFYGGTPVKKDQDTLKNPLLSPHIVVGTPGRILALIRDKSLQCKRVKHFVLDECDKMVEAVDMRRDVQEIFRSCPLDKQVMMFTATLAQETRPLCRKFLQNPLEIYVDDETKLTLHGLQQHYVKLQESEKTRRLNDLLDQLEFNQVCIFVKSVSRANELNRLLVECNFPSVSIHSGMKQEERIKRYQSFKNFEKRIMVSTDILGRGIDIERVNIVINYDMPDSADSYLHRVGRAGRFGTKGLAVTFVASAGDTEVLNKVQERFEVNITEMPSEIDTGSYMTS